MRPMNRKIYLDHNASTPLDPRVAEALIAEIHAPDGNPSSVHAFGREVRNRLTKARRTIAKVLGVNAQELIFTSGGTEAMNMAIAGILKNGSRGEIITSNVEHSCVYESVKNLESQGHTVSYLSVGSFGAVTPQAVEAAITPNTRLIVLMAVNNETGAKTDIAAIAALASRHKIPFIVDGVAQLGKEQFTIPEGVTAYGFSGHKIHAPKGIGLLYLKRGTPFQPLLVGGGQEHEKRGGTENMLGIIALAKAFELLELELPKAIERMAKLRQRLEEGLKEKIPDLIVHATASRICNTSNISFPGVDGESLLMNLDLAGVAVSHGSACSSGALEPSRVLLNMGIPKKIAATSIRFSLSRMTTEEEIETTIELVARLVS